MTHHQVTKRVELNKKHPWSRNSLPVRFLGLGTSLDTLAEFPPKKVQRHSNKSSPVPCAATVLERDP